LRNWITLLCLLTSVEGAAAQGTYSDTVQPGVSSAKWYAVRTLDAGQLLVSVSWDNSASKLGVVVVCGVADPEVYGIGGADLDRFARIESGIARDEECLIGVASLNLAAAYRLSVQFAQAVHGLTSRTLAMREAVKPDAGVIDRRLIERGEAAIMRTLRGRLR
jgi:hypothetical protein